MRPLTIALALALRLAAQQHTVAGIVVGNANRPLSHTRVALWEYQRVRTAMVTADDGRFSFQVPEGSYSLTATHDDWTIRFGSRQPVADFGSAIITGPGKQTSNLTLRWYAPGAIFGAITGENGEPLRDVDVRVVSETITSGRRTVFASEPSTTDDRGQFRIAWLAAGSYYVFVGGKLVDRDHSTPEDLVYPPAFYPGTGNPRNATLLTLAAGGEIRADVTLRPNAGSTVELRCPRQQEKEDECYGASIAMMGMGGVELPLDLSAADRDGRFAGLAPGRYVVRVANTYKVIDIGAGKYTFDIPEQESTTVEAEVTFKNPPPKGASLYLGMASETSAEAFGYPIPADGTPFPMYLSGSPFRPRIYGSVPMFIAQLALDGTPIRDGIVDLTGKASLVTIVASDEVGRLKGFATQADQPAPGVIVVLRPAAGSANLTDNRGFQTESDGSFDYTAVPAGDYLLFAVDQFDLEYTNLSVIKPYLSSAIPVHVDAHATTEQNIAVRKP